MRSRKIPESDKRRQLGAGLLAFIQHLLFYFDFADCHCSGDERRRGCITGRLTVCFLRGGCCRVQAQLINMSCIELNSDTLRLVTAPDLVFPARGCSL